MFKITNTGIDGLVVIDTELLNDRRGMFTEMYRADVLASAGIDCAFVQDNMSVSKQNVLRGLHFQTGEHAQAKLVSCLNGMVVDVAVDIRKDSSTYGKHFMLQLMPGRMLFIPAGFAHGFYSLFDGSVLHYKCSRLYSKEHEAGIVWNDKDLGIDWPAPYPIVSDKDAALPMLRNIPGHIVI